MEGSQTVLLTAKRIRHRAKIYERASCEMDEVLAAFDVKKINDFYRYDSDKGITRERWSYELQGDGYCSIIPQLYLNTNPGGRLEFVFSLYRSQKFPQGSLVVTLMKSFRDLMGFDLKIDRDRYSSAGLNQSYNQNGGLAHAP